MGASKYAFERLDRGTIVRVYTAFEPGGYSLQAWAKYMQVFGQPHWKQPNKDVNGMHGEPYIVTIECGSRHSSMMQVLGPDGVLSWFQAADFTAVKRRAE